MNTLHLLSGKVTKTTLPVLTPGGPTTDGLKRLMLPQGNLAQIHDAEEGIRYLAWLEFKAGVTRGNHYHLRKREYLYLIAGEVEVIAVDLATQAREQFSISAGDLVFMEPNVAHVYRPSMDGEAVEFSPVRFDPGDTLRHVLIPATA